MKWTIQQLRKLAKPFEFEYDLDLNEYIENSFDIIRIEDAFVTGICREIDHDVYQFELRLTAKLFMECSVTLEEVLVNFDSEFTETYGNDNLDYREIVKDTINLIDAIVAEIYISKPLKVVKEGCEDIFSDEEPKRENPFAALKDLIGGEDK